MGRIKTKYWVYRVGQPVTEGDVEFERFAELKPLINGLVEGRLEHVAVLFEGRRADMFVEEYSASSNPPNLEATKIYHASSLSRDPGADVSSWPMIHGTAVLFEKIVWT